MIAEVLARIRALGVLPVVELPCSRDAVPLADALVGAGLPAAEITLRTEAGLEAIRLLAASRPDVLVGAGTVRTAEAAEQVIAAGAAFVVSPGTSPAVIAACRSSGVAVLPGACTPTEVDAAVGAGADAVKFFPAEAIGGVRYLKALCGPFRDVAFVPTGGIDARNLAEYLRMPQVIACGGSWLVSPELLAAGRFDEVETLARAACEIVVTVRAEGTDA